MTNLTKYKLVTALRLKGIFTGERRFTGGNKTVTGASVDRVGISAAQTGMDNPASGESYASSSPWAPPAVNDDVWKRRVFKRGITRFRRRLRLIKKSFRFLIVMIRELQSDRYSNDEKLAMLMNFQPWKDEDLDDHRRKRSERELFQLHKEQAKLIQSILVDELTNLGFCHHVTRGDRKYIRERVRVTRVDVSPFAYIYHIGRTPFSVKKTEMAQDWVSTEIAARLGKKTRHELDLYGLRYTVEIGSTLSIPDFVPFSEIDSMPKNLPPLAFFVGRSTNGAPVYRNLAEGPHMIVAGSSGGGKSNMANCIACTYLMRKTPDVIRMVFFDLKGGIEFSHFAGVPHLFDLSHEKWSNGGIIEYPDDVIPALNALFDECHRRLAKLKAAKKKNIAEYNRGKYAKNRLPYIVVFFDEYATTKKLVGDKAETILSNIANLSRSAGIHFVLATQYPKAEIINTAISVNFPWRVAFNMSTGASQSVLGNWDAFGLSPTGRAIFQSSEGEITVQTPRITNSAVMAIVSAAKSGGIVSEMASVDIEELLAWAINNTGGKLDRDTLFNQFKDKITQAALNDLLKSTENQIFEVQGVLYTVLPPRGQNARRMELVTEPGRSDDGANDKQQTTGE